MKLDKKDMQILGILDWNARMPITQIAKKTGLNKDVVKYRIKNLEKKGIIEGYYSLINTSKLGFMTVRVYLDLVDTNKEIENKIVDYLDNELHAGYIFSIDGEYQLGIISWEKSIYELGKKLRKFKERFGDFLGKEDLSIFTTLNHYPRGMFPNASKDSIVLKEEEAVELKKNDLKILDRLSNNARITSVDLSYELKIPQRTVIYTIKKLEKERIILGYRAKINIEKLGYGNYFLEIYTHNGKDIAEIEKYAKSHKNCTYSSTIISASDIEVETEFQSKIELLKFINELKEKFKSIKKIKYWSTIKYFKSSYLPRDFL